jgi:hypothetical protein
VNLNINREWLIRMAEKEGNGIISVGGFFYREDTMIVEAPPEIVDILTRWRPDGTPWYRTTELTRALQPYRGMRLLTEHHVICLAKVSDRLDDVIMVMPRSSPLRDGGTS